MTIATLRALGQRLGRKPELIEDRQIVLFDNEGQEIHRMGAHFSTPGCSSFFAQPLNVSRIEVRDAQ